MKIEIDTDKNSAVSLDRIIDLIFDSAADSREPSEFDFIKRNDSRIMTETKKYAQAVRNAEPDGTDAWSFDCMAEELAAGLTDTLMLVNLNYFKQGMKFGARVLSELIF